MGSEAKREAFEQWKGGRSLDHIKTIAALGHGTSMLTVEKWVRFWNRVYPRGL